MWNAQLRTLTRSTHINIQKKRTIFKSLLWQVGWASQQLYTVTVHTTIVKPNQSHWSFAQCVSTKLEVLPVWATAHALQRVFLACEPPPASCCVWTPVHAAGHTDALKAEQTWWFSEAFIFSILKWNEAKNACVESTNKGRLTTPDRCRMCDMGQQQRPGSHTEVGEKNKQGG